ncbi:caspase domain-containing protein [Streptomyces sp. 846.5]|nr:caspase family protein [Streptomyces sp. 846.5]TDU05840.1 caspase domain-containing protein [Streptomyces sp. 846.5]
MKKALVVGIDHYANSPLHGCVADAQGMAGLLERNDDGSRNYTVRRMTSDTAAVDRGVLRTELRQLFASSRNNQILFYFAGHGVQTPWGAELVTQDFSENALGVSMNDVLTLANDSPAQEVVIILDACFSGDLGNIPGLQPMGLSEAFGAGKAVLKEGVTLLAASQATETSAESGGHGAYTRLLLEGLEGAAADPLGNVSVLSLYDFVSRAFDAWEQRPVFKSHITQSSPLRICKPGIDPALLRKIPDFFSAPAAHYTMTPEHEGVRPIPAGQCPTSEQDAFDYFKALRNAGLLTTDNEKDLYFVALASEDVYLTALGRYFWKLAKEGKL